MRITAIKQMAKGLASEEKWLPDLVTELDSIKWYLWHGIVFRALQELEGLDFDFGCYEGHSDIVLKLGKAIGEFHHYISANQNFIPNYGKRYRYGEKISTAFV